MRVDVYVPVLAAALLGLVARPLARLLAPVTGVRVLVGAGVCCAAGWVWALGLLTWAGLGTLPVLARFGGWSSAVLRADNPVPAPVASAAGGLLLAVVAAFSLATWRRVRAVWGSRQLAEQLCRSPGELVVLPDLAAEAFALPVPGRRSGGRIVVSAGMLRALDVEERRVLFAHERAHLAGAHHWWLLVAQLASAANPLLARLPAAVDYLLERAADEAAAAAVGDRRLAAQALARAGLAVLHSPAGPHRGIVLGYAVSGIQARVAALLAAPPPTRRWLLAAVLLTLAVVAAAAIDAGSDLEHLFELASAYPRH